jgi:hypothetical protein
MTHDDMEFAGCEYVSKAIQKPVWSPKVNADDVLSGLVTYWSKGREKFVRVDDKGPYIRLADWRGSGV